MCKGKSPKCAQLWKLVPVTVSTLEPDTEVCRGDFDKWMLCISAVWFY